MEKQAIIAYGVTPPVTEEKVASGDLNQLDDDVTKRAANAVTEQAKKDARDRLKK